MPEETEARNPSPMVVSLDLELLTLMNATRGAEILADYQTRQGFMDDEAERDAPVGVFSILSLVGGRLDQLRRVIRGEEDPAHIWAPHNSVALPDALTHAGDIVLVPWKALGKPLVIARHLGEELTPEELERKAANLELKGKEPKGGKPPKRAKGKEATSKAPGVQGGASKETPLAPPSSTPESP